MTYLKKTQTKPVLTKMSVALFSFRLFFCIFCFLFSVSYLEQAKAETKTKNTQNAEPEENESWYGKSVFERPRSDYTIEPMRFGSLNIIPTTQLSEGSDSNIYATKNSRKNDFITKVNPAIGIESDWSRHAIKFNASGDLGSYAENTQENYQDYSVGASGRLDVLRETFLLGSASTSHLHEDRGDPNSDSISKSPTKYNQNNANVSFIRSLRRVSLKIDSDYTEYDYLNGESNAGSVIDNNGRNRNEYKVGGRVGYEIIPEYEAFIRTLVNKRDYVAAVDSVGVNRDSAGYEIVAGTALNLGGKTKGEIYAGYLAQNYDTSALKDVAGTQFGGNLLCNITGITAIKIGIVRGVQETTAADSSGFIATSYSFGVEHELLYNLLVGLNLSYQTDSYQSTGFAREDKISGAGAELRYLMNRNVSIIGKYNFSNRDSNLATQGYDRSLISIGLKITM